MNNIAFILFLIILEIQGYYSLSLLIKAYLICIPKPYIHVIYSIKIKTYCKGFSMMLFIDYWKFAFSINIAHELVFPSLIINKYF